MNSCMLICFSFHSNTFFQNFSKSFNILFVIVDIPSSFPNCISNFLFNINQYFPSSETIYIKSISIKPLEIKTILDFI